MYTGTQFRLTKRYNYLYYHGYVYIVIQKETIQLKYKEIVCQQEMNV